MRTLSHADFLAMRRFDALDGLRAIAAVIVVAFHFGGSAWGWTSGWIGVHLFFVLSGFLITTLLLREESSRGRVSLRAFYTRRFFRILPVYFVVLAATWALAHVNGRGKGVEQSLIHYLLMVNEFAPTKSFLHSWTIAIEQKFYLVWPLLAFVLVSGAFYRRLAVTGVAVLALLALVPVATDWPYWPIQYVVILAGCLLAIIMHNPRSYALVRPLTHPVAAVVVVIGFTALHLSLPYWPPAADGHNDTRVAIYAVGAALLLPALLTRSLPARILALRPLAFIGERSYSLYLVQYIAAAVVAGLAPSVPRGTTFFLATVVVGLLAADLLHRWVELPMIDLGRRLAARGRKAAPEAAAPSAEVPAEPVAPPGTYAAQRMPVGTYPAQFPHPDMHPVTSAAAYPSQVPPVGAQPVGSPDPDATWAGPGRA
ncbi:acyltransferase [Micromonospora sp. NPDC050200]|uniref:acyltransferase family protein n=1 Tax=Micromonospora sp. NPDC050200 TaxID=3155664 RepID=UPI0033C1B560